MRLEISKNTQRQNSRGIYISPQGCNRSMAMSNAKHTGKEQNCPVLVTNVLLTMISINHPYLGQWKSLMLDNCNSQE